MAKTIVIQPVTRIEGHAKVTIQLNDAGNVDTARVNVIELRGFEKFCLGKPVEDLPRITPRICGVCPWSHHLASAKACDAVFGVDPPPAGKKLRELCNSIAYMEEHILHFYFLAGADFLLGPDADYSIRNVIGVLQAAPDIATKVVKVRHLCAKMLETIAGKSIHPLPFLADSASLWLLLIVTSCGSKQMRRWTSLSSPLPLPRRMSFPSTSMW